MKFNIIYHSAVKRDIKKLGFDKKRQLKLKNKIEAIAENPYPKSVGGLGEPLKGGLKGLLKFRFDNHYRVVYQLVAVDKQLKVLIVGIRADGDVYNQVSKRL